MVAREGMRFLADHPLAAVITARVAALVPAAPNVSTLVAVPPAQWGSVFSFPVDGGGPAVQLGLDAASGALSTLVLAGEAWADAAHLIGELTYLTFDDADLATQGAYCCFGHDARQAAARPNSTRTTTALMGLWIDSATAPRQLTARMTFPAFLHELYGAPSDVWATLAVTPSGQVEFVLQVFNKTATRLAEAALLGFTSRPGSGGGDAAWRMRKLESWIDPLDGVAGGSPHSHVVSDGVALASRAAPDSHFLAVDSLDAAVFSPATAATPATNFIVPFDALEGPVLGFSALLWQNAFNTNTPLFSFTSALKWRFVLRAAVPAPAAAPALATQQTLERPGAAW